MRRGKKSQGFMKAARVWVKEGTDVPLIHGMISIYVYIKISVLIKNFLGRTSLHLPYHSR